MGHTGFIIKGQVEVRGLNRTGLKFVSDSKVNEYVHYFNPADPEEDWTRTQYDSGIKTQEVYEDGVSYIDTLEAEANFILAMDAIESASTLTRIEQIEAYVLRRIKQCKFYLPLKKRKEFFSKLRELKRPYYFKQEANKVLLALDLGKEPKAIKKAIYNLHIPLDMKRELWAECDKEIELNNRIEFLKELAS